MTGAPSAAGAGVLDAIVASKREEVARLQGVACAPRVSGGPRGHVATTLRREKGAALRLIAENKRKSPSAGPLSSALSAAERALAYADAGASMISVLCDGPFFGGSWDDLAQARRALDAAGHATPLLAKEFVLHERQLEEARASGADAVLLIARILGPRELASLFGRASALGLEALVEVMTDEELGWAVRAGAPIIGVNARDLDALVMDAERAQRVLDAIPEGCVPLYLSGLKGPSDVARLALTRAHGALVGETLMRQDDPRALLRSMALAAAPAPLQT